MFPALIYVFKELSDTPMLDLLNNDNAFWVFPIKKDDQKSIRDVATQLHSNDAKPVDPIKTRDALVDSLNSIIDSAFVFYYEKPSAERDSLSPIVRKAANSIVNAVRKTIHLVIQKVFKKMSIHDLKGMAAYLDSMAISEASEDAQAYLGFPLKEELRQQLVRLMTSITEGTHIEQYSSEILRFFSDVVQESTHHYYHKPMALVNVGGFAKKAADLGIDTTEKGILRLIKHVLRDISHDDIKGLPENIHFVVITLDLPYEACTPKFIENK